MRTALDAMGGDHAPQPNIEGALAALLHDPQLEIVLVGDEPLLRDLVEQTGYSGERLHYQHSEGVVGMNEKPTDALRNKPRCSIAVCWQLMASREVDAVVSAGHTGAVVAAGLRTRLFLKGVKRPGIAVAMPTIKGHTVLMDVGANPAARAEHLYQYAVMGEIYARDVLGVEAPRIGLMNIGSEDGKGTDLVRETHALLINRPLKDRYIGNVEGRGLYLGDDDVIFWVGIVGNVVLKVSEGVAQMMLGTMAQAVVQNLSTEREHAEKLLRQMSMRFVHNESGGAPLLGIDGICIIGHGSSNGQSITNALRVATTFRDRKINSQIVEAIATNKVS